MNVKVLVYKYSKTVSRVLSILVFLGFFSVSQVSAQTVQQWSNPNTWGGTLPTADTDVIIGEGKTVEFDAGNVTVKSVYIDHGGKLIFKDQDFHLTTKWIVVHGTLQAGTATTAFNNKGIITLIGTDSTENAMPSMGTKGILVHGGIVDLHGKVSNTSWTKINQTALKGSTSLILEKSVDWKTGDKIVIASTDFDAKQAEELTITSVNGNTVHFTPALAYEHFGVKQFFDGKELDERAEVALLTRNLLIQGGEDSVSQGFGGHIMAMAGSVMRINGVELYRMGQKLGNRGVLGRYAIHFHLGGDVTGSYTKNTSIHHTFNRCITIHGTDKWLLTDNVCYNAVGHMYFFEDAVERFNILERNIGILARRPVDPLIISDAVNGFGPAVFWISNPNNILRENVAAGSEGSGFWFDLPESPTGASVNSPIKPRHEPLGEFSGNITHSNDSFGIFSEFMNPTSGGDSVFDRVIVYKNGFHGVWSEGNGPLFGGGEFMFTNGQFADNTNSIINPGWGKVRNSLFVGESANKGLQPMSGKVTGVQFYGGPFGAEDSTFVNYKHDPSRNLYMGAISWKKDLVVGVAHDNWVKNLRFVNANEVLFQPQDQFFPQNHGIPDTNFPTLSFWDKDGTLTGVPYGMVSNTNSLLYSNESTYKNAWNAYSNPYSAAQLFAPCYSGGCKTTIIRDDGAGGYIGSDGRINLPVNRKYTLYPNYTSCNINVTMENQLKDQWLFIEMPYSCSITKIDRNQSEGAYQFNPVQSIAQVESSQGGVYYLDTNTKKIYFKLYQTVTRPYDEDPDYYRDGIRITGSGSNTLVNPPNYAHPAVWQLGSQPVPTSVLNIQGDANGDGRVDGIDYLIWLANYNKNTQNGSSSGDFNNDNKVDGVDYILWMNKYLKIT